MICEYCRHAADMKDANYHELCKGGTHCDCQHKVTEVTHGVVKPVD